MIPRDHLALENAKNLGRVLTELNALGPRSMDTRYGLRRNLSVAVPTAHEISVSNLRTTMDHIRHEFELIRVTVEHLAEEERAPKGEDRT